MDNCKIYKDTSMEILKLLENHDLDRLEDLMNKRDEILKEELYNANFKKTLIEEGILDIDFKIKKLLNENINVVKKDIVEHKKSKQVNKIYMYNGNQKINIFNQKI